MNKTLAMLQKIGLFRSRTASGTDQNNFEMRMNKIHRAREAANGRGAIFKNRPSPSKA